MIGFPMTTKTAAQKHWMFTLLLVLMLFFVSGSIVGIHASPRTLNQGLKLPAQPVATAALIKDIRSGINGSSIGDGIWMGDVFYFCADDGLTGQELWRSDGTEAGTYLVRDVNFGSNGSVPQAMTVVSDTLYFTAFTPAYGRELWASNGTEASTRLVRDIDLIPTELPSTSPYGLTSFHGRLFFIADDGVYGAELWVSDGSEAGTQLLKDINAGSGSSEIASLGVVGDMLYFGAFTPDYGTELWKSDGTAVGTQFVYDIEPGPHGSWLTNLTASGKDVYFTARHSSYGVELWKSDGTEKGTYLVKDIYPGSEGSMINFNRDSIHVLDHGVYFFANDGIHGHELWRSDGTEAGTYLLRDIHDGHLGSKTTYTTVVSMNRTLYLVANDGIHGQELWRSDGTTTGTELVKDINSGGSGISLHGLAVGDGQVYFIADDGVTGQELWSTDGTVINTRMVRDIALGSEGSEPFFLPQWMKESRLMFVAYHPEYGHEFWHLTDQGLISTSLYLPFLQR